MTVPPLVEKLDRWILPLSEASVLQCCIDWGVSLRFDHSGDSLEVRISERFMFGPRGTSGVVLDPEADPTELGPLLQVTRTSVRVAEAFKDGRLEMVFADDSALRVPAGAEYEPWEFVGPGGVRVVSLPGGDLAIWNATREE